MDMTYDLSKSKDILTTCKRYHRSDVSQFGGYMSRVYNNGAANKENPTSSSQEGKCLVDKRNGKVHMRRATRTVCK